ncbi:AAA family ATPase [Candidatus Poribacteria bacterium]|nr:AAA family ATPase [Candidatus Poribacteria bacterium]
MYKSFHIQNFRCFKDFSINNLERVNLIAGGNNVGKTALLEAIFLHAGGTNIELTIRLNGFRGYEKFKVDDNASENIWVPLFYQYDEKAVIDIEAKNSDNQMRRLRLKLIQPDSVAIQGEQRPLEELISTASPLSGLELEQELCGQRKVFRATIGPNGIKLEPRPNPSPFPCHFLAARMRPNPAHEAELYGHLETENQEQTVLELLKIIEPNLKRLAMIVTSGVPTLHGDIGLGRLIPLAFMGDGMGRLASLVIAIANASGGVVLIDEIENGMHHSIMTDVWLGIAEIARRFDVQIFATTHSYECLTAAHRAFKKSSGYDFRLHRLDLIDDSIKARTFDEEMLEAALKAGWEVR